MDQPTQTSELLRVRREELKRSLETPHPENEELADLGLADWATRVPAETADLPNPEDGVEVRWQPGRGWREGDS